MAAGKLIVQSITGKDLSLQGSVRSLWCVLEYDGLLKTTSRVDPGRNPFKPRNPRNPRWHEKFEFVINDTGMPGVLKITIRSEDPCGLPTFFQTCMGNVTIPISTVPQRPGDIRWYPIMSYCSMNVYNIQGDLGLVIWLQTPEPRSQDKQPASLMEGEGSSSVDDLAASAPLGNPHDLDDPMDLTNTLESIESEIDDFLSERMVARAAHLEKVKEYENAHHSRVVDAFESLSQTEWSIRDTSPLCGSRLVTQSLQRTQSMLASKQALEGFHISKLNLIPRIDDAVDNERRLVTSVTKAARDAEKQQMQLRDMEQNAYRVYLDLIEKQNKERMEACTDKLHSFSKCLCEVFKTFQREEEQLLNLWAASRRETLDIVRGIESGSQPLVETSNTLVETTRKYERKLEAEIVRVLGGEAAEEISVPSKSECRICFDCIEGPLSGTSKARKQRSCLTPCNHAMICLPCATGIWESTKSCPFCKVVLTTRPRALYLG